MRVVSHAISGLLAAICWTAAPKLPLVAQQEASRVPLPYSGGLLMARAVRAGEVQLPAPFPSITNPVNLTCSPAPCVLPDTQASEGGSPVNEDPIAANPKNSGQLLSGGNDYNCTTTLTGFFASNDAGSTWNHNCMNAL